jgi:hypothetical protein
VYDSLKCLFVEVGSIAISLVCWSLCVYHRNYKWKGGEGNGMEGSENN